MTRPPDVVPQWRPLRGVPGQLKIWFYMVVGNWSFEIGEWAHGGYLRVMLKHATRGQRMAFSERKAALVEMLEKHEADRRNR